MLCVGYVYLCDELLYVLEQRCYELDKKLIESSTRLDNESLQHAAIANRFSLTGKVLSTVMCANIHYIYVGKRFTCTVLSYMSLPTSCVLYNFSETELKEVMSKKETLESSLYDLEQENVSLKRIKAMWTEEKLNLQHIIEKRDLEIAKLNGMLYRLEPKAKASFDLLVSFQHILCVAKLFWMPHV